MEKRHSWAIGFTTTALIMCWSVEQRVAAMPGVSQPPPAPQSQGVPQPSAVAPAELRRDAASPASPKPENGVGGKPIGAETGQPDPTTQTPQAPGVTPAQASVPPATQSPTADPVVQQPPDLDTVNTVDKNGLQGNWVKKRQWLMDASAVNNQIQDLVTQNEPLRKTFIDKYTQTQAALENYYNGVGLQQGQLQELFEGIERYLEKKRKRDLASLTVPTHEKLAADIQAKMDTIEATTKESKHQLEQLMLDMKSIEDLDRSLQDRIKRFDEYCNTMQEDANRAKSIVNDMWNIIDHNIARDRYYELNNNILEKTKATQAFLQNEFSQDFDTVGQTIAAQIAKTQDGIKALEDKGFIIKNRTERLKEERKKEKTLAKVQAAPKKEAPPAPSWYDRILGFFSDMAKTITSWWHWLTGGDVKQATTQVAPTATPPPLPKEIHKSAPTPAPTLPAPAATPVAPSLPITSPEPPQAMPITPPPSAVAP